MRILVYGMQSSGASLFTFFLAQKKNRIAIIDLFNKYLAPSLDNLKGQEVLLKVVVTKTYPLKEHINSYKPDKTILFLRNPYDNYVSLSTKKWKNENGRMIDKFKIIEKHFNNKHVFDSVVYYDNFINKKEETVEKLNDNEIEAEMSFYNFSRKPLDIRKFNRQKKIWGGKKGMKYSTGRIHFEKDKIINEKWVKKSINDQNRELVYSLCPNLCDYYEKNFC